MIESCSDKVQFGCGPGPIDATGWLNFDASPSLRILRVPLVGPLLERRAKVRFDPAVRYGDIARGLPLPGKSVRLLYSSHVLEHLSLADLRKALRECRRLLSPAGYFRSVMPDLSQLARNYLESDNIDACSDFMRSSYLGLEDRPRGIEGILRSGVGNSRHLWLWDYRGIEAELRAVGFTSIRRAGLGDSRASEFSEVECPGRWDGCLGFECKAA